jgi:hypothetical protein
MIAPSNYKQCKENVLTVCLDFQNILPFPCSGKNNKYLDMYCIRSLSVHMYGYIHKALTNVEYRAVLCVFQNIDPPPLSPPSECVLPPHQRRGVHTRRRAVKGVGCQYFGRRQT